MRKLILFFVFIISFIKAESKQVSIYTLTSIVTHSCCYENVKVYHKFIKDIGDSQFEYRIKKIVIDPGHGGKDSGTLGSETMEKDIALKISLELGNLIANQFPNVQVIYTRTTDIFIPLYKRAELANELEADLFISIHCNAIENASQIHGSEVYVMGLHTATENLEIAKRENASILLEDDFEVNYDGFNPNSDENHIVSSMFQNAFLEQSIFFASQIGDAIRDNTVLKNRGVRQAGFVVLRQTTMPSVLIETGYLTNSKDNKDLATTNGQKKMAFAIFEAFQSYKDTVEN